MNTTKILLTFTVVLISLNISRAQWSETSNNETTGNLYVGTTQIDIQSTGVENLVIGDGTSSKGLVINAGSNNDAIVAFANSGSMISRFQYNNSSGELWYFKPSFGRLLTVSNEGNLGIGTDPWQKLDISGVTYLRAAPTHSVLTEQLRIGRSDLNVRYHSIYSIHTGNASNNYIQFRVHNGNSADPTEQTTVMTLNGQGYVGIGIDNPTAKLEVDGNIISEEVKVQVVNPPDYVFSSDYSLRSLEETKAYITENQHLPEVPSAKEMEANGIQLGEMNMLLLKKIEELTLYQIELLETVKELKMENKEQAERLEKLEKKSEL